MPATHQRDSNDSPQRTVFEFAGGRFEMIDAPGFLVALPPTHQAVLQPGNWPAPLTEIGVFLEQGVDPRSGVPGSSSTGDDTSGGRAGGDQIPGRVLRLQGRVTITTRTLGSLLDPGMIGNEYVAPLVDAVSRLLIAGGLSGKGGAGGSGDSSAGGRRWNPSEPPRSRNSTAPTTPPDATIHSKNLNITGAVRYGRTGFDGRVTHTIDATVPLDDAGPDHLAEFVRLVCDYARRQVGRDGDDAFLRGRTFTLSRRAAGGSARAETGGGEEEAIGLDQIGGLDDVVHQLREIAESFRHPEVMARWGARRPQGVLMFGPPGSGKTTLAKALAMEIGATLKEIRTPDIMTKWVGQSERNVKKIFTDARAYRTPTVLLFDEFDSIVSYTGAPQGSADQALNSVAGIFKQEMNTLVADNPNVIVVATTNFPQRVDDSLIRSGRFDVKLAVPLPDGPARADIFGKKIRRLASRHDTDSFSMFAAGLDLARLSDLTTGMSGADIEEILRRVQMAKAMQEARGGTATAISQSDLEEAVTRMRPRYA